MIPLTMGEVAASTGAELWAGDPATPVRGVSTDTRTLRPGELFLALAGPNHDGDRFAPVALERGAAGVLLRARERAAELTARSAAVADGRRGVLVHEAPRRALGELAASYRARLSIPVVAVTGACGRATTRALLCELLGSRGPVAGSPGSHANDVGVPHTLFRATAATRWLVVEMGVDAPGGVGALCATARPTAAVLTGAGVARLPRPTLGGEPGRGLADHAAELVAGLPPDGFCVLPADCPYTPALRRIAPGRTLTFGVESGADVDATDVLFHAHGTSFRLDGVDVTSPLLGLHDLGNLCAALAACRALGLALADVLPAVSRLAPAAGGAARRGERREAGGVTLLADRRPADAAAAGACARALAGLHGHARRVLVVPAPLARDLVRAGALGGVDQMVPVEPGVALESVGAELRPGDVAVVCGAAELDPLCARLAGAPAPAGALAS